MGLIVSTMGVADIGEILRLSQVRSDKDRVHLDSALSSLLSPFKENTDKYEAAAALQTLLTKAALDVREMLAERLVVQDDIPVQLLLALAYDKEITVAKPVLIGTSAFDDEDWDSIIHKTTPKHWQLIANRHDLKDRTVSSLLNKQDDETTVVLLGNQKITLQADMMDKIKSVAFRLDHTHERLLERNDLDIRLVTELYWSTSLHLRNKIVERFNLDIATLDNALENIVQELINASVNNHEVTEDLLDLSIRYAERRDITAQYLIKVLRRGQIAFFIALFAQFTKLDLRVVRHIVLQEGGEPLAIACKSKSLMKSDFASFFLMTRAARPGEKRVNQGELSHALATFDKIKKEDAKKIIQQWISKPESLGDFG